MAEKWWEQDPIASDEDAQDGDAWWADDPIVNERKKRKSQATAADYLRAMDSGLAQGVTNIAGGIGTFIQDPAANALSGVSGAAAAADRGITWATNAISGKDIAKENEAIQENARTASRFAAESRDAQAADPTNLPARFGRMLQRDSERANAEILASDKANNPELIAQQQNTAEAQGFVDNLAAIKDNPLAFAHTMARSAPDMAAGVGVGSVVHRAGASLGRVSTAGALSEASSSALQSRQGVYQQVNEMPLGMLAKSPRFQAVLAETQGDPAKAREILANELADQVPLLAGAGTALGTVLTNKLFGGDATAKTIAGVERMGIREFGKRVAQDTVEEGFQGVPEDAVQYGASVQANPAQQYDPGGSAAQNLAAGFAMGAGGHSLGYARDNFRRGNVENQTPAENQQNQAPALSGQAQAATNSGAAAGNAAARGSSAGLEAVGVGDTAAAEEALKTPVQLTALDRADALGGELQAIAERQQELAPENGYGPAFDGERQDLATKAAELAAERESITATWPKAERGAMSSFTTEAGARLDAQYALMDAGDLVTSHDEGLAVNPLFPKELQPRDRSRQASELQVSGIVQRLDPARLGLSADAANGAPIVGADGLVESGNARTIALKRVYQANGQKAENYKQFLRDNAAQFGLAPEAIDAMAKPVLVRVRATPVNRAEFARQANASTVQRMSPSEQALSDAKRLNSLDGLNPDEQGDFGNNMDFVRQFMATLPVTEQSDLIESDGRLSTAGYRRIQNAVLARAYGDSPSLRRMTESMDNNLANISKALVRVAPTIAAARERMDAGTLHQADIAPDLLAAVEGLSALKEKGWKVSDELGQADLTGPKYSPEAAELLTFLSENARSPRRIAEFFQRYYDALEHAGDPTQPSMFGDDGPAPTRASLINTAKETQNGNADQDPQRGVAGEGAQADARDGGQPQNAPRSEGRNQGNGPAQADAAGRQPGKPAQEAANDAVIQAERAAAVQDFKDALGDLAQIATKHTRAAMVPENTPGLMPALVKLYDAAIRLLGSDAKAAKRWVVQELRKDARFKTFWNKIDDRLHKKAALQAMEAMDKPAQGGLFYSPEAASDALQGDLFAQPAAEAEKPTPEGVALDLDGVYAEAEQIAADIAKAPTNAQEGIAAAQAKAARFAIGKSLTKEQRKQVLESLVDTYKTKGAEREFKGQDSNGNDRYGYVYSPELFEKSDITGAMVRYYVTLPDGRIAHPTELFPDVSASDVERMALEQESKKKAQEAYENAIKPFYQDFDSANLMTIAGQVVISKGDRLAIIPNRIGAVNQARQQGWELAKPAPADVRRALQVDMEGAVADGFVEQGAPAPANDRNAFTLQRLNRDTGQMESLTFERGEYVRHRIAGKDHFGEIDGISHARREFSVDGLWYAFGFANKAERPAAPKADTVPLSSVIDKMNAKNGQGLTDADRVPEQKPASKTPTVDRHNAAMAAVREGIATPDQFKASFEAVVSNKDAIKAELSTKTKAELLKDGGAYFRMRYANENKADVVDAAYGDMLGEYALGESVTYGMARDSYQKAVRRLVEATDAGKLARYVADRKAAAEEYAAQRAAKAAALESPQTLTDYRSLIQSHINEGKTRKEAFLMLTPEQRIQYDTLEAESTKEARESRKRAAKTEVRTAGQTTGGEIIATKHTRDGYDLFVVKLADRLSADDYKTVLASAKKLGGWYSAFRGNGAIPGFQFKDKANAEAFLSLAGGDTTAAQEQVAQRRDAFEDDRSQGAAERLNEMAGKLEESADEEINRDRKANTARRARFASAALGAARAQQAMAKTMRNIAKAIEDGRAKFLDAVRTKTQVEMLTGFVRTAKDAELRAKYDSYAEQEKRKGEPATAATADFAEFPAFTAFRSDLATLARQMLEVDGTKKMGQQLMKVADDVTDAYLEFAKANIIEVSAYGNSRNVLADFDNKVDAENAIRRNNLTGKAIVLPMKRGHNRVILSPSEAMNRGIWKGDGDKRITLTGEFAGELVQAIGRRGSKQNGLAVPWQFQTAYDRRKALARIGIETPSEFRSALREFVALQETAVADKVRDMELSMVGRKADGLDFFPTPAEVADQMVEAADIQPDMAVLEPSAGMGHLADRIREAGAEPDVIEIASDRRALLEEKGYTTQDVDDFLDLKPREFFTFGDTFRAPDGAEGIMRGASGNRVRLVNDAGDMVGAGYYDRAELTGVSHNGTASGYDRIVMNPPFSNRRDAEHVRHAYSLLKPGGRIVAIMGEGVFFGNDKKAQDFREWLESVGGTSEKLPDGSFLDPSLPVTTGANARMVVIDKADSVAMFSRAPAAAAPTADSNARNVATQMLVDGLKAKWTRAPEIIVARNMQDPRVPQAVRDYDETLKSQGATGEARGFIYKGKVYLLSDQLNGPQQIAEVLFHEVLGHYGLRGAFGDSLDTILQQIGIMRRRDVVAKAREYGLFDKDALGGMDKKTASDAQIWAAMSSKDRLSAAEEVLAEMAQTQPTIGFVKRAIALIRNWLRSNVPGFKSLRLTDADIIAGYIIPARGFVTRSNETPKQSIDRAMLAFSRVWHGSPHKFLQFDSSKIGTGEGAQAYGHGLYLADRKGIATGYKDNLSRGRYEFDGRSMDSLPSVTESPERSIAERFLTATQQEGKTAAQAIQEIKEAGRKQIEITKKHLDEARRLNGQTVDMGAGWGDLRKFTYDDSMIEDSQRGVDYANKFKILADSLTTESVRQLEGKLYQVDLPDDQIAKMLDWDKPLSEQPPEVQKALASIANGKMTGEQAWKAAIRESGNPLSSIAKKTGQIFSTPQEAADNLQRLGIPGIRYLDGGSRGRSGGELVDVFQSSKGWQAKIRKDGSQVSGQIGDIIPQASQITTSMPFKSEQEARQWAQQQIGAGTSNYVIFPGMEKILTIIDVNGEPVTGAEKAKVLGEQMDMAFSRAPQSRSAAIKEMLDAQAAWDKMKKGDAENITLEKFSEMTDRSINARTALADELVSMPDDGFALQAKTSDGRMLILTPSAQKSGKWQLTRFGSDGTPWGDTNFDTKKQAALEFIDEADLKTIQGADNEGAAFSRGTNEAMTNKDVVGNTQGGRSADDNSLGTDENTGLPLNADGTVTVYHHTSKANADAIRKTGTLKAQAEPDVYVTTRRETDTGYGDTAVPIRVRPERLSIDDEFPDGRKDFRLSVGKPGGSINVTVANESTAPDSGGAAFSRTAGDQTQTEAFKRWFGDSKVVDGVSRPTTNSNGAPLSQTEEGVKAFWRWFGDSKIVDSQGRPLVVYHSSLGSKASFDKHGKFMGYTGVSGISVTDSPEMASRYLDRYAEFGWVDGKPNQPFQKNVMALYVRAENPLERDEPIRTSIPLGAQLPEGYVSEVEKQGYDALIRNDAISRKGGVKHSDAKNAIRGREIVVFDPTQIKSATGNSGAFDPTNPDIRFSRTSTATGTQSAWDAPLPSSFDDVVYKMQDKHIDTKRVVDAITAKVGQIKDAVNVYLQEELFHGRAAKRVADFGAMELKPVLNQMRMAGLSLDDVEEFLHARHAKEANALIAQREPGMPDGGSGMTNQAADDYMKSLTADQKRRLEAVASKVDAIIGKTRQMYADYGLEDQKTVDGWGTMFANYVPLMREGKDGGMMGIGQGFTVKGKEVKGRTGSTRKVVDILANIAAQREKVIVRGEKNRVATALVGLAAANPNKEFWETRSQPPTERVYDAKSDSVVDRPDSMFKQRPNVVTAKVKDSRGNVTEQSVVFNEDDPRAMRMAAALKNLDAGQLEGLLGVSAKITRYFSAINTQYNPVFGVVNLVRDVQGAMVNLGSTELAGQQAKIAKNTLPALAGIYKDVRAARQGKQPTSKWSALWDQMQEDGGTTGYRELFSTTADRANSLKNIIDPNAWADGKWGKVFTANGKLKVPLSIAKQKAGVLFDWLSDYNEAMENGVRLAAYSAALDKGMTRAQAASLSKNLTVNFNRKGQVGQQAGALYAFFNAAMQGTARIGQVLFEMDGGDYKTIRLSSTGKKVIAGGLALGSIQAMMLAAAGFGDDEPPDFVRERSLVIPTGGKGYISIPMPLGLHVIPGLGRHATEFALNGFKDPAKRAISIFGMLADAFNPIGNAGLSMQTLAPTALDPLVALTENKDWTGKPIARTSSNKAVPGHSQWKDTASSPAKWISEAINTMSGGDKYVAGALSPTPDQIDYLFAQVTGGVGRELAKVEQTAGSFIKGEELPTYKVPLVGRFYGNAGSQASEGTAFYASVNKLNEIETKAKAMRKDGKFNEAAEYLRSQPDAPLILRANAAERQIQKLKRDKRDLIEKGADREQVRAKEEQITAVMANMNRAVEARRALAKQ